MPRVGMIGCELAVLYVNEHGWNGYIRQTRVRAVRVIMRVGSAGVLGEESRRVCEARVYLVVTICMIGLVCVLLVLN